MHNTIEIWLPIGGFEALYQVSNRGNVRSLDKIILRSDGRKIFMPGKNLKLQKKSHGYIKINLYLDKKGYPKYVHDLVLTAFVGPRPTKIYQCRHLNGNKSDNRYPENLCWGTPQENGQDTRRLGLVRGENNKAHKLTTPEVQRIKFMLNSGTKQKDIAKQFNVSTSTIQLIKSQRIWNHV